MAGAVVTGLSSLSQAKRSSPLRMLGAQSCIRDCAFYCSCHRRKPPNPVPPRGPCREAELGDNLMVAWPDGSHCSSLGLQGWDGFQQKSLHLISELLLLSTADALNRVITGWLSEIVSPSETSTCVFFFFSCTGPWKPRKIGAAICFSHDDGDKSHVNMQHVALPALWISRIIWESMEHLSKQDAHEWTLNKSCLIAFSLDKNTLHFPPELKLFF